VTWNRTLFRPLDLPELQQKTQALRDLMIEVAWRTGGAYLAQALSGIVDGHRINWVWMPPWGPDKITDDGREQLRALGFNV